jgi:integral membrane protein
MDKDIKRFKWVAKAEGISFLILLGIAMPLKYAYDMPKAVTYFGWVHGALFIVYAIFVLQFIIEKKWSFLKAVLAMVAALLPFGPFVFDRKI